MKRRPKIEEENRLRALAGKKPRPLPVVPDKPEFGPRTVWHDLAETVRGDVAHMRRGDGSLDWGAVLALIRGLDLGPFGEEFVLAAVGDLEREIVAERNRELSS